MLFQHLLELDEQRMQQNLSAMQDIDESIYIEVCALIAAHYKNQQQTQFSQLITNQAGGLVDDQIIQQLVGKQIGIYKLVAKLGQGGMGTVYLGERNDQQLQQKVAIKFVLPSIVALSGQDFLQKEAQHLANLDHPNIASIITIDTTDNDLPYMVMEYVDGVPINQYCQQQKLNLTARLKLFQKVCQAVQIAHQNMIIHADIKPSNILVDSHGNPKLMDFGIARHLDQAEQSGSLSAASRDYASPEQRANKSLTVATDIYALGKLLNELLINQAIAKIEKQALLDKTLSDNQTQQFSSVATLEQEIDRLIQGRALVSIQSNYRYRLKKTIKRNPKSSVSLAAFLITLIVSSSALLWQYRQITIEKQVADQSVQFLENVFEQSSPYEHQNKAITVEALLTQASNKIAEQSSLSTASKNRVSIALAKAMLGVGAFEKSQKLLNSVVQPEPQIAVQQLYLQAQLAQQALDYPLAITKVEQALEQAPLRNNEQLLAELYSLKTSIHRKLRQFDVAQATNRSYQQFALASNNPKYQVSAYIQLSGIFFDLPDYQQAEYFAKQALETYQAAKIDDHALLSTVYYSYGSALEELDQLDQAELYYQKLVALDEQIFGDGHPTTGVNYSLLSYFYHTSGDYPLALEFANKAIAIHKQHAPYSGYEYVDSLFNKAHALKDLSQPKGAIAALLEAEQVFMSFLPEGHSKFVNLYNGLGVLYKHISEFDQGEAYFNKALSIALSAENVDQTHVASLYGNLGNIAVEQQAYDKAESLYQKRHKIRLVAYGYESRSVVKSLKALARVKRFKGANQQALELLSEAMQIALKIYPAGHPSISGFYAQRALTYRSLKQLDLAVLDINKAIDIAVAGYGEQNFSTFGYKRILADLLLAQGFYQEAYDLAKPAYDFQLNLVGAEHAETKRAEIIVNQAIKFL